jgi:hypothetical protein
MREGLLWFDDDPRRQIEEKVAQAATRYRQKFGIAPDICYVNEQALNRTEGRAIKHLSIGGLSVQPLSTVRPHHFWVGRTSSA